MDAVEYLKTRERICSQFKACSGCEFDDGSFNCPLDNANDPENAVKLVEKWAKEHPRKTNLEKIKELFPDTTFLLIDERGMIIALQDYENFSGTCFWDKEYKEKESETAEWIKDYSNDCILPSFRCSKCNKTATFFSAYCPHCGMKMKRECKEEPKRGD